MDFNAIIKRVIAIITKPVDEWKVIKEEQMTVVDMYTKYAIILAAIPAVAGLIGNLAVGRSFMGHTIRMPFSNSFMWTIFTYILSLGGVYLMGLVIDLLAPNFGAEKNFIASLKVALFSYTAAWVAGIFYLIPALSILAMVGGLYSLYLLYLGIKEVKSPPAEKAMGYFVTVIIVQIVIGFLIGFLVARIAFGSAAAYM